MIIYLKRRYRGQGRSGLINVLEQLKKAASLQDVHMPRDQLKNKAFYIFSLCSNSSGTINSQKLCRCLEIYQVKWNASEISGEYVCEEKWTTAILHENLAKSINIVISSSEVSIALYDFVVLHQPHTSFTWEGSEIDEVNCERLKIAMESEHEQCISVYKPHNENYVDSFSPNFMCNYSRIALHNIDYIGSVGHALCNLISLVRGRGKIISINEIAEDNFSQNNIVLAKMINYVTSMKLNPTGRIKILLEEIVLGSRSDSPCTRFCAVFSGAVAAELKKAVDNEHVTSGDLFAISSVDFLKKNKVYVNTESQVFAIKCQNDNLHKSSKIRVLYVSDCQDESIQTNNKIKRDSDDFKFVTISRSRLKYFIKNERKLGSIKSLVELQGCENSTTIFVAFFLKLMTQMESENKTVVLFLREVSHSGYFVKAVLHNKLVNTFLGALKSKRIACGDIVMFKGPCVFFNPELTTAEILKEEPYLLEIGIKKKKRKIDKCKLKIKSPNHAHKEELQLREMENPEVESENRVDVSIREVSLSALDFPNGKPAVFLFSVTRPYQPASDLDYVSGFCADSCKKMFVYSSIKFSPKKDPLCPYCSKQLVLVLCFEMDAITQSGEKVKAVLVDKEAETFLTTSCEEYLTNPEKRRLALMFLERKTRYLAPHVVLISDITKIIK